MKVILKRVGWMDFRPWKAKSGSVAGSLAWSVGPAITIRWGMDYLLWGLPRVGHELEHALDPSFGNEEHHPAIHQCLRSYSFRRNWKHAAKATPELAKQLRKQGYLEIP